MEALNDSLLTRGLVDPVYRDLVSRYMDLWLEYQELSRDIAARGVVVMDEKRGMLVENRSLTIRHQTSNKMLDIFKALGFDSAPGSSGLLPYGDDEL